MQNVIVAPDFDQRSPAPSDDVSVRVHRPGDAGRRNVEWFINAAYARAFAGRIRDHYPTLISIQDAEGRILAAAGIRLAREETLFLEQYLDLAVEAAVGRAFDLDVDRAQVAEIGNLASSDREASRRLFLALARHLELEGCAYAAATATRPLRQCFCRGGLQVRSLAKADAAKLNAGVDDWGSYYACDPEVVAGPVASCIPRLAAKAEASRTAGAPALGHASL